MHSASGSGIIQASCNELSQGSCQPSSRTPPPPTVLKQDIPRPIRPESGRKPSSFPKKQTGKCAGHSGSAQKLPPAATKLSFRRQTLTAPPAKQSRNQGKQLTQRQQHPETRRKRPATGQKPSENQRFMLNASTRRLLCSPCIWQGGEAGRVATGKQAARSAALPSVGRRCSYFSCFQIMSATVRPAGMNGSTCSL